MRGDERRDEDRARAWVDDQASPASKRMAMAGIGASIFMFTLDGNIVNIAMPTLVTTFNTTFATVQWVALSYLLVITSLMLGAARLGDRFGKRRAYLWGLGLFTLSSLLCGMAPDVGWLIAFRALQGLGSVFFSALAAALVTLLFPPSERGRAMGIIGSMVLLGVALGPSVGGFLLALAGWRWLFFVNLPVGAAAAFLIYRSIPDALDVPQVRRFDWLGTLWIGAVLLCFSLTLTRAQSYGFGDASALLLFIAAVAGAIGYRFIETLAAEPLIDLSVFHIRPFSLGVAMGNLVFVALSGIAFIQPFFLELVLHYPPAEAGLILAVSPVVAGILSPIAGSIADRVGSEKLVISGLALMAAGCLAMTTLHPEVTAWTYIARVIPIGIGMSAFQSANSSSVMGALPHDKIAIGSGLVSLARSLGQSIGVPLAGLLFAVFALHGAAPVRGAELHNVSVESVSSGVRAVFLAALAVVAVALVLSLQRTTERSRTG